MNKNTLTGFNVYGVRVCTDDESYKINDTCRDSYEWDYENDCSTFNADNPITLNGTCAIMLDSEMSEEDLQAKINYIKDTYCGDQIIIIGGNDWEYGSDEFEVIIQDARVLDVINND